GRLASGGSDHTFKLWDVATGEEVLSLQAHAGSVAAVAFSGDGLLLASAGADGAVRVWDGSPSRQVLTLRQAVPCNAVAFDRSGQRAAWAGLGGDGRVWEAHTGPQLPPPPGPAP